MNRRALVLAISVPLFAAVVGNAFVSENALAWYDGLDHPWFKLLLWGSAVVALLVYMGYGLALYRTLDRGLRTAAALAAAVLVGNELWNLIFFGTRDLVLTFWVTAGFALLILVQAFSVRGKDSRSFGVSMAYLVWVVLYDLPWLYRLSVNNAAAL